MIQGWQVAVHFVLIFIIVKYICEHEIVQIQNKIKRRKQVLYILLHTQLEWHARDMPRRGECKEAHQGLLVCTYLHWGLPDIHIASQLYLETLSLKL